jgi:hypothetical protein
LNSPTDGSLFTL